MVALFGAFYSSTVIIIQGFQDWNENPILMTVETFDSPLQSIEFPAITLCPSNEFQPDNWDLTEKVLNYFKFNCEAGNEDCTEVRILLEPFFEEVFYLVSDTIERFNFDLEGIMGSNKILSFNSLWDSLTPSKLNHIYWAMEANKLDLAKMNEIIVEIVGREYVELYNLLPKQYNGSGECNKSCLQMKQDIIRGFIKADVLVSLQGLKLGTMLRQFSDIIGKSFKNDYIYIIDDYWYICESLTKLEIFVFESMKKMAPQFGMKASLHDIPNVFAKESNDFGQPVQFYPLHSICSLGFENVLLDHFVSKFYLI